MGSVFGCAGNKEVNPTNEQEIFEGAPEVTDYDKIKLDVKKKIQQAEKFMEKMNLDAEKQLALARQALKVGDEVKAKAYMQVRKMTQNNQKNYSNQFQQLQAAYNNMKSIENAKDMTETLKQYNSYMQKPEIANLQEQLQEVMAESAQTDIQVKKIEELLQMGGNQNMDVDEDLALLQDEINQEMNEQIGMVQKPVTQNV